MAVVNYPHPPIAEAILSLQFKQDTPFDCSAIERVGSLLTERFPLRSPIHLFQMNVGLLESEVPEDAAPPVATQVGIRLANLQNDRVLQIQNGNFTFSHLPPYTSWEVLRQEFEEVWKIFFENYDDIAVTRCATRFINKISIPSKSIELHDYFHLYPKIPEGIPQDVTGMLLQVQMPQSDLGNAIAVVNLALAQPEKPDHLTVLLDLDLFTETPATPSSSSEMWSYLDRFRDRKNQLFEAFITDETRKLFK